MTEINEPDSFDDLRELVNQHIRPELRWYTRNTFWPRMAFRAAGVFVVIGSLLLPVITATTWSRRGTVLTAVSLAVAVVSSLSTFFRWDAMWQSRIRAVRDLSSLLAKWELNLTAARAEENPRKAALLATQALFDEAFTLIGAETKQFFDIMQRPGVSKSN